MKGVNKMYVKMTGTKRRQNDMFVWLKERIQKGEKEINVVCFYVLDAISLYHLILLFHFCL